MSPSHKISLTNDYLNRLSLCHFVQVVNESWYLRSLRIDLPGYQISLRLFSSLVTHAVNKFYLFRKTNIILGKH